MPMTRMRALLGVLAVALLYGALATRAVAHPHVWIIFEATVIHDDRPGAGPLAALAAGMRHLRANKQLGDQDAVFVTGCDAPFLTAGAVGWLSGQLGSPIMYPSACARIAS